MAAKGHPSDYLRLLLLALLIGPLVGLSACRPAQNAGTISQRTIQNKGSDTLVNLALAWAEAYQKVESGISIAVTGGGSGTGIAALINGTTDIANASRQMSKEEIAEAQANGINPVEIVVAIDALAVLVNPSNPVGKLTIDQLSDIFTGRITNWKQVGGEDRPIVMLSRETNSGTHVYFLDNVVRKGQANDKDIFAPQTLLMPSSVGISSEVRRNPNAIGYDGLGYVTNQEKVIAVAKDSRSPFVLPSAETAANRSYVLARNLYMYTAGQPTGTVAAYLDWIRGKDGQAIVTQLGFVPLPQSAQK